jgi:iron complex outermembrane receptor protein
MTNVKSSFRRGIELTFAYRFNELFELNGNIAWSQNRIQNYVEWATANDSLWNETYQSKELGETHLIYSPELISGIGMKISPVKNFNIILNSKYVGAQYFDNTSSQDRKLKPYFVINAGFEYQVKIEKIALFKLNFFVNNLSDNMYISNAYGGNWYENNVEKTWAYYFPQAGRNYMLKLTAEF